MEGIRRTYRMWCRKEDMPSELARELASMKGDDERIRNAFYKELAFGTAGLRGVMGVGTNRVNELTIAKVTRGLADCAWDMHGFETPPSVAIGYDSRKNSQLFAEKAAKILLAKGIKVRMFRQLMPVPVLSYAVRRLKCDFGIMITASHNPKNYNGYKVYDHTGGQIREDVSGRIQEYMGRIDALDPVEEASLSHSRFSYIEQSVEKEFLESCLEISAKAENIRKLHIVYTPLNGTGRWPVLELFHMGGADHVEVVEEQQEPDSEFITCPTPNPELEQVYELGLTRARRVDGDIVIATDPDCDRVGVALNRRDGPFYPTGNQTAVLLLDYLIRFRKMSGETAVLRTITGTPMVDAIAASAGIETEKTMVGFKYIGERIEQLAEQPEKSFFFAFEEGNGYLAGDHVRDKDGVSTSLLIAQMAAYHKARGKDLKEALDELYDRLGYYEERVRSHVLEGFRGAHRMKEIMNRIRGEKRSDFLGRKPMQVTDYLSGETYYFGSGGRCDMAVGTRPTRMPKADIMEFVFIDESKIVIRPSGTEPKIKAYFFSHSPDRKEATAINDENEERLKEIIIHE